MPRLAQVPHTRWIAGTATLGTLLGLLLFTAPAVAASSVSVSPSTVVAGGTVVITGTIPTTGDQSCLQDDAAIITSTGALFPPDGFGPQASRDASGAFHIAYTVATSTPAGTYAIGLRCGGGNVGVSTTLRVKTPAVAASSVSVSPSTVLAGGTVVITGAIPTTGDQSCLQDDVAIITSTGALFPPDGFGPQASRDASGAFHIDYTVPTSTPAGTYAIGLRCGGSNIGVNTTLRVKARVRHTSSGAPATATRSVSVSPSTTVTATATRTVSVSPSTVVTGGASGGTHARWWLVAGSAAAALAVLLAVALVWRRRRQRS